MAGRHWRGTWGIVLFGTLAYTCLMFIWFSLPAFLTPIVDEIGLTSTQAGILVGAVPATYIPLALATGLVVDRIGPGRTIGIGVFCYGIGQIARSTAESFPSFLVWTVLIGVGATTITFGLPKLVAILFPPDRTGPPSSLYLIGASVGSATVFATGRQYLGPMLGGWRELFFWSGVAAVGYGILWLVASIGLGIDRGVGDGDNSRAAMVSDLRLVLGNRNLQLLVIIGTMYLLLNHGLQGWLPTLLESRGMGAGRAGQTTSILVLSLAVGTLSIPTLADHYRARRRALFGCGLTIVGGLTLLAGLELGLPIYVAILITGIGIGGIAPLLRAIPPALEGLGPRLTGTAVGFIFAVGEIGGFLGPVLIGLLHDVTGSFLPGLVVLGTGGLLIVVATIRIGDV